MLAEIQFEESDGEIVVKDVVSILEDKMDCEVWMSTREPKYPCPCCGRMIFTLFAMPINKHYTRREFTDKLQFWLNAKNINAKFSIDWLRTRDD